MCFDLGMFYRKGTLLSPGSCRGLSSGLERERTGRVPPWGCSCGSDAAGGAACSVSQVGTLISHTAAQLGGPWAPRFSTNPAAFLHFKVAFCHVEPASECTRDKADTVPELMHLQPKECQPPFHEIGSSFCPPLLRRACVLRSSKPRAGAVQCALTWALMGLCKSPTPPPAPSCHLVPGTISSPRLLNPSFRQTHSSTLESSATGVGVGAPGGGLRMALSVPKP